MSGTISYKEVKRRVLNTKYQVVVYKVMSTDYRWMSDAMNDTNIRDTVNTGKAVIILWEVPETGRYCDEVVKTKDLSQNEARSIYKEIIECTKVSEVMDILEKIKR